MKVYSTGSWGFENEYTHGPTFLEQAHAEKYCKVHTDFEWTEEETQGDPGELHTWWTGAVWVDAYREKIEPVDVTITAHWDGETRTYPAKVTGYVPIHEDVYSAFRAWNTRYGPPVEGKVQPPQFSVVQHFGFEPHLVEEALPLGITDLRTVEKSFEDLAKVSSGGLFRESSTLYRYSLTGNTKETVESSLRWSVERWLAQHPELEVVEL